MPPKAKNKAEGQGDPQKGKPKARKPPAHLGALAAIRKVQEAQKVQKKIDQREAEARKRREEEEKRKEEELRVKLEQEMKERKAEQTRKIELRKTKKERDEKRRLEAARAALLGSGVEVAAFIEGGEEGEQRERRPRKKKVKKPKESQDGEMDQEPKAGEETLQAEKPAGGEESWEDFLDDDEKGEAPKKEETESETESSSEYESSDEEDPEVILARHKETMRVRVSKAVERITGVSYWEKPRGKASSSSSSASGPSESEPEIPLRSPIVCILGHVDVGKTLILDKLRSTNVQGNEAGGITQQIGASFFPIENLRRQLAQVAQHIPPTNYDKLPGLLIIDTPGHESFSNLRSRGSSLCNVAVLVVDIRKSLENQTKEALQLILRNRVPFIIALNKIDMITQWVPVKKKDGEDEIDRSFDHVLSQQSEMAKDYFNQALQRAINDLAHEGVNAALYTSKDVDFKNDYIRIVPTSAMTGEGLPDLLANLLSYGQMHIPKSLQLRPEIDATVMEVKTVQGLGTTMDVILANGALSEGDRIIVCGTGRPIVSQVRALMTPKPLREMRVKSDYTIHKDVMGSMGVRIYASDLEHALAGSKLFVAYDDREVEPLSDLAEDTLRSVLTEFEMEDVGTYVVASTVGSLEALVTYLQSLKRPVPIAQVSVGRVNKIDVKKASIMREKDPKYSVILAFDVEVDPDAAREAEESDVTIFTAPVIYHLTEKFDRYLEDLEEEEKKKKLAAMVYPCKMSILQAINHCDPLILGVKIEIGKLRPGAPIMGANFVKKQEKAGQKGKAEPTYSLGTTGDKDEVPFEVGFVQSIEMDRKPLQVAVMGQEVAIKISRGAYAVPTFGRKLVEKTTLFTKFTRDSIDNLKEYERADLDYKPLREFIAEFKQILQIPDPLKAVNS